MKHHRRSARRILTSLLFVAISITCALNGNAKLTYRGFVEGGLGVAIVNGAEADGKHYPNDGGGIAFSYMLATTHGIQLKKNFIGVGIGITPGYCAIGNYINGWHGSDYSLLTDQRISKVSIPAYANWRYDFFEMGGSFKPYIGVKAGIFLPVSDFEMAYQETRESYDGKTYSYYWDSFDAGFIFYGAIDLGFRKRISDKSGISLGICLQSSNNSHHRSGTMLYESLGINILAKIAFDF